jgi:hypothetical protein
MSTKLFLTANGLTEGFVNASLKLKKYCSLVSLCVNNEIEFIKEEPLKGFSNIIQIMN